MRKLFLLLPALVLSLVLNAKVINITPNGSVDLRHAVRDHAVAGDTIVLADGEYVQTGDYTQFNKNLVIMAKTGAAPVVKLNVPAQLLGGSRVEFKGIKFDMENSHSKSWYEHLISVEDYVMVGEEKQAAKVDGNILIFDGCEFYNDTLNNSVIYCPSTRKIDSVIVNDCQFYNIKKNGSYIF